MKKLSMVVGSRTLCMDFDLQAWLDVEAEFGSIGKMYEQIDGDTAPMTAMLRVAAITANAGERKNGCTPDITTEWMVTHMTPKQARHANSLAKLAIMHGMKRETVEDDGDIDMVAKELQKKNPDRLPQENA